MAVAALAVFLIPSCVREELSENNLDIHFGAQAPVSTLTKTVYSYHQETVSTELWERIDWENGDLIRIYSDQVSSTPKYFDYDITLSENVSIKSYATASPHGAEHGLQWGSGTHTFFSMYPSPSTTGVESGVELELTGGTSARATGVLPADQSAAARTVTLDDSSTATYYGNMKLAYMTAATEASEGTQNVTLSFKPMVTTFFVTVVNTTGSTMTLKKVELTSSSSALTGQYRIAIDKSNNRPGSYQYFDGSAWGSSISSSGRNNIYAAFPSGISIPATGDNSITVALFALPHEINNLTLTVTADETGPVSLPLKYNDAFISFAGEKKHNISNINVPSVSYTLDVSPATITYDYTGAYTSSTDDQEFTVTSYKYVGTSQKDTPWETEIWIDANNDGIQDDAEWNVLADVVSDPEYSWLSNFPTSSASAVDADDDSSTATHTFKKSISAQNVVSHEERLRNGVVYETDGTTPVMHNSAATAVDLSYYDFVNRKLETSRYTANTYIISAPGYYKIPIVYGNAIENGARMADSYSGRAARLGHLDEFICPYPNRGGTESSIHLVSTRPWLNDRRSASARIHWEKYSYWDESSSSVLTSSRRWSDASTTTVVDDLSIVAGAGNERYIVFNVREDNIRPGNLLIASLDSYDNVQWSWQIWITDADMHPITVNNGSRTYSVMPENLGWTDLEKGLHYEPREAVLRFASTEKAGLYSAHTLTVQQTGKDLTSTNGWSTFYQWGRKDPLTDGIAVQSNNDGYLHESIKHPSNIMYDKSSFWGDRYYDWTIHNYSNLWESKNTAYDSPAGTLPNHKTVYDPSPRRYCVPPDETFDGFASTSYSYASSGSEGIYFYTGVGSNTIFFPAAGLMNYTSASSSKGNDILNGYWTYHPGEGTERRASYCLSFKYNNSTHTTNVWTKQYQDNVDYISRAYGLSVRPIQYDDSAVINNVPTDGTQSVVFNFEEMWGDGTGLSSPNNLDGFSTNNPSAADDPAYQNDFTLSFESKVAGSANKIRYAYDSDNGCYVVIWPESTLSDESSLGFYSRITVSTNNPNIHIVQIVLSVIKRGNTNIRTDSPTFSEGTWADSNASFDEVNRQWTSGSGKQSVTFTTTAALLSTNNWEVSGVTVNYYVDSTP